jgi:hypothetical protein
MTVEEKGNQCLPALVQFGQGVQRVSRCNEDLDAFVGNVCQQRIVRCKKLQF